MADTDISIDQREQRVMAVELAIGRMRALQMDDLAELDRLQVATSDGAKNMT
jgi:hypothetical protein